MQLYDILQVYSEFSAKTYIEIIYLFDEVVAFKEMREP